MYAIVDPKRVPTVPTRNAFNTGPVSFTIFLISAPRSNKGLANFTTKDCVDDINGAPLDGKIPLAKEISIDS